MSRHFDPDNVELRTICCTTAHNPLKKLVANLCTIVDVNDPFRFKDRHELVKFSANPALS